MPKSSVNASLSSYDDIFSTEESRQEEQREQVRQIPIGELFPFKNHPFKVLDDDSMSDTVESVKQYGVLSPLIARPRPKGGYEIISGHRRQHAAELAGLETLPVIVRQMDDDAAIILMVDSNLQREHILPSERAFAYKMKLDAMKNQGTRSDLTSTQVVSKLRSNEKLGAENNQSRETVRRFIRLTNLIPELLDMVDNKTVSFNPAVELSYLSPEQQQEVIRAMDDTQNFPSVSQAKRMQQKCNQNFDGELMPDIPQKFLNAGCDVYMVMQLRHDEKILDERFASMRELNRRGKTPDPEHYEVTYYADLPAMWQDVPNNEVLEELFQMFNLSRPQDFEGHSLSVSDVIALKRNGEVSVHYVDSIGFKDLQGFLDKQPERPSVLMNLKEKCDAPECNPTVCRKVRAEHEL